jgi:quercetin dioxygenase-like cupin family protein
MGGKPAGDRPQTKELNMTTMKKFKTAAMAAFVAGAVLTPLGAQAQESGVTRTDLQRRDLSAPGREAIQVRVDLAPGVAFGKHTHPGEEVIYVLEGTLEYQIEDKPPVTLKAGDVLFIPAGTVHSARNPGSVTGSELATYIVEKGKPLLSLVK